MKSINHHSLQWMIGVDLISALFFPRSSLFPQMKNLFFAEEEQGSPRHFISLFVVDGAMAGQHNKDEMNGAYRAAWAAWGTACLSSLPSAASTQKINKFLFFIDCCRRRQTALPFNAAHPSISFISFNQFTFWFVNWWRNERLWAHYTATDLRQQIKNYSTIS